MGCAVALSVYAGLGIEKTLRNHMCLSCAEYDLNAVLYDVPNYYFETDAEDTLRRRGVSEGGYAHGTEDGCRFKSKSKQGHKTVRLKASDTASGKAEESFKLKNLTTGKAMEILAKAAKGEIPHANKAGVDKPIRSLEARCATHSPHSVIFFFDQVFLISPRKI